MKNFSLLLAVICGAVGLLIGFVWGSSRRIESVPSGIASLPHHRDSQAPAVEPSVPAPAVEPKRLASQSVQTNQEVVSRGTDESSEARTNAPWEEFLRQGKERAAKATAAKRSIEYSNVFARFGLASGASEQLIANLAGIDDAYRESSIAIQKLGEERLRYDRALQSVMSPEDYARYRKYEEDKPAADEASKFEIYVRERGGTPIEPGQRAELVDLIRRFEAYTVGHGGHQNGPFGTVPRSGTTDRAGYVSILQADIRRLEQQSQDMLASMAGVPSLAPQIDQVRQYYADRIQAINTQIERVRP